MSCEWRNWWKRCLIEAEGGRKELAEKVARMCSLARGFWRPPTRVQHTTQKFRISIEENLATMTRSMLAATSAEGRRLYCLSQKRKERKN